MSTICRSQNNWVKYGLNIEDAAFVAFVTAFYDLELEHSPETDVRPQDDLEKEDSDNVWEQLESGNDWAWCWVKVSLNDPQTGDELAYDSLGCCSYASEKDFITGGYFVDMVRNCWESIKKQAA